MFKKMLAVWFVFVLGFMPFAVCADEGQAPLYARGYINGYQAVTNPIGTSGNLWSGCVAATKGGSVDYYYSSDLPDGVILDEIYGVVYGVITSDEQVIEFHVMAVNTYGADTITVRVLLKDKTTYFDIVTENEEAPVIETGSTLIVEALTFGRDYDYYFLSAYPDIASVDENTGVVTGLKQGFTSIHARFWPKGTERPLTFNTKMMALLSVYVHGEDYTPEDTNIDTNTPDTDAGDTGGTGDNYDTGDTGITDSGTGNTTDGTGTVLAGTILKFVDTTESVAKDSQDVDVNLEVAMNTLTTEEEAIIDAIKGKADTSKLYVLLKINGEYLFAPDLTEKVNPFRQNIKVGTEKVFNMKMNKLLRMALKGQTLTWTAVCVDNNMNITSNIATKDIIFE